MRLGGVLLVYKEATHFEANHDLRVSHVCICWRWLRKNIGRVRGVWEVAQRFRTAHVSDETASLCKDLKYYRSSHRSSVLVYALPKPRIGSPQSQVIRSRK
jgi:hypothetical protein